MVGSDPAQIRFLEHELGAEVTLVSQVNDDMLLGVEGRFYRVLSPGSVGNLSPEMRGRTGIWSADTITKGSAAILIRYKLAHLLVWPMDA